MSKNKQVLLINYLTIPQTDNIQTKTKDQLLKYPNQPKQNKLDINDLKITQSHFVQAQSNGKNHCRQCLIYKQKLVKLQGVLIQFNYFKQINCQFKQEIELLVNNFMYILELASQNIEKGLQSKLQKVLKQKQNIIKRQAQIIEKLQNESQILIDKVDAGIQTVQKIQKLEQKIKALQIQNLSLKGIKNYNNLQSNPLMGMNSTDAYTFENGEQNPQQLANKQLKISSVDLCKQKFSTVPKSTLKILKRKTLQMQYFKMQQTNKMKSLKDLKTKINSIKQKLINQKF